MKVQVLLTQLGKQLIGTWVNNEYIPGADEVVVDTTTMEDSVYNALYATNSKTGLGDSAVKESTEGSNIKKKKYTRLESYKRADLHLKGPAKVVLTKAAYMKMRRKNKKGGARGRLKAALAALPPVGPILDTPGGRLKAALAALPPVPTKGPIVKRRGGPIQNNHRGHNSNRGVYRKHVLPWDSRRFNKGPRFDHNKNWSGVAVNTRWVYGYRPRRFNKGGYRGRYKGRKPFRPYYRRHKKFRRGWPRRSKFYGVPWLATKVKAPRALSKVSHIRMYTNTDSLPWFEKAKRLVLKAALRRGRVGVGGVFWLSKPWLRQNLKVKWEYQSRYVRGVKRRARELNKRQFVWSQLKHRVRKKGWLSPRSRHLYRLKLLKRRSVRLGWFIGVAGLVLKNRMRTRRWSWRRPTWKGGRKIRRLYMVKEKIKNRVMLRYAYRNVGRYVHLLQHSSLLKQRRVVRRAKRHSMGHRKSRRVWNLINHNLRTFYERPWRKLGRLYSNKTLLLQVMKTGYKRGLLKKRRGNWRKTKRNRVKINSRRKRMRFVFFYSKVQKLWLRRNKRVGGWSVKKKISKAPKKVDGGLFLGAIWSLRKNAAFLQINGAGVGRSGPLIPDFTAKSNIRTLGGDPFRWGVWTKWRTLFSRKPFQVSPKVLFRGLWAQQQAILQHKKICTGGVGSTRYAPAVLVRNNKWRAQQRSVHRRWVGVVQSGLFETPAQYHKSAETSPDWAATRRMLLNQKHPEVDMRLVAARTYLYASYAQHTGTPGIFFNNKVRNFTQKKTLRKSAKYNKQAAAFLKLIKTFFTKKYQKRFFSTLPPFSGFDYLNSFLKESGQLLPWYISHWTRAYFLALTNNHKKMLNRRKRGVFKLKILFDRLLMWLYRMGNVRYLWGRLARNARQASPVSFNYVFYRKSLKYKLVLS